MAVPPPALWVDVDELVEEILLRLPPDDPAFVVRAALVCKHWNRLVSDPGFRRRLAQLHGTPPMLGFFYQDAGTACFTPTSSFSLLSIDDYNHHNWRIVDARHGRVLFDDNDTIRDGNLRYDDPSTRTVVVNLVVSSPITGVARRLPVLRFPDCYCYCWSTGMLCAAAGCDHLAWTLDGAFTVVLVGMFEQDKTIALVYSSELQRWSSTTAHIKPHIHLEPRCSSTLVGGALCFLSLFLDGPRGILRYDLGKEDVSFVRLPPDCLASKVVLLTAEDGGLGFAMMQDLCICMWARGSSDSSSNGWTRHKAIKLNSLLVVPDSATSHIVAEMHSSLYERVLSLDVELDWLHAVRH